MKQIVSLLLAFTLVFSAALMVGCQKEDKTGGSLAVSSIPEDLTPISKNSEGNPTGYSKVDKDDQDRVIRNYTYDSLGKLKGSVGYEYDENGFVAKDVRYDADGNVTSQVLYERDESGLETKRTTLDADGNVTSVIVTEYNEDGSSTRQKYDAQGNPIS